MDAMANSNLGGEGWTEERVQLLATLWDQGWSATEIARHRAMGGEFTRNAVCGKIDRLKLPLRNKLPLRARHSRAERKPVERRKAGSEMKRERRAPWFRGVAQPPQMVELPPETTEFQVGLLELREHHCRWPVGDAVGVDQMFCGAAPLEGLPYCTRHSRMAYVREVPKRNIAHG